MRMGGGDAIGARRMDGRMDRKRGPVHRVFAFDHFALAVDQDQVRNADLTEIHSEGVDPEMVVLFGVARGNVPGDAFVEPELGEEAEGGGQPLLAVQSLFLDRIESRWLRQVKWSGRIVYRGLRVGDGLCHKISPSSACGRHRMGRY